MTKKFYFFDLSNNKHYYNTLQDIRRTIKEIYRRTSIKHAIYIEKI